MKSKGLLKIVLLAGILLLDEYSFAQQKWPGVVLYNFDFNGVTKNFILDPIVRISNKEFSYPVPIPPETWDKVNSHELLAGYFYRFCNEEYTKGRKLELFMDGLKCGSAAITGIDSENSCSPVVAEVKEKFFDSSNHHFEGHGLVIASTSKTKPIRTFIVDSVLEKKLYDYGKDEFIRRGVRKVVADRMEIKDVRADDLDGDGKPEYLISYFIIGEDTTYGEIDANMQYSLFLILDSTATGYKQVYSHYPDPAIPQNTHLYKFIDVLDLDGDGVCEVMIQNIISMIRWDYIVLKKKGDIWEEIYEGGGGGC
jgi:hypothetical protein